MSAITDALAGVKDTINGTMIDVAELEQERTILRNALHQIAAMLNVTKADREVMREAEKIARAALLSGSVES